METTPIENILGIRLPYETRKKIEKNPLLKRILNIFQENRNLNKRIKKHDFQEMKEDLEYIQEFKELYLDYPLIDPKNFETFWFETLKRDYAEEFIPRKYKTNYQPYYAYEYFNQKNKSALLELRIQIDRELGIECKEHYKI